MQKLLKKKCKNISTAGNQKIKNKIKKNAKSFPQPGIEPGIHRSWICLMCYCGFCDMLSPIIKFIV